MNGTPHDDTVLCNPVEKYIDKWCFFSGEDPERGKEQHGQPDPQGIYIFKNIYFHRTVCT